MTSHIPENFFTWLVDWSPATIMHTMPPRDPNEDDDDDDEDEDDENQPDDPPVVREPDDDE